MTWTPIAPAFLVGMTFSAVTRDEFDGLLAMTVANSERVVRFAHYQDCCEHVRLEDVVGDLNDLIGTPIVVAEEVSSPPDPEGVEYSDNSHTWTFYKLRTAKGDVTLRFLGESSGYYSESVDLEIGGAP